MVSPQSNSPRPVSSRSKLRRGLGVLAAVAVGLSSVTLSAPAASAASVDGLTGSGSSVDPLVIDSVADLNAATVAVNTKPGEFASLSYRLDANLDYKGETFPGFTATFSGSFDGNGHSVSNFIVENSGLAVGFFDKLDGATVKGLTIIGANASSVTGDASVGLITPSANNSTISGNTILDSIVKLGPSGAVNTQAAGIAGATTGTTVVRDNLLWNVTITGHKYAAALVTYPRASSTITRNLLVDTKVVSDAGGAGATAGLFISQGGAGVDVSRNIVIRGSASKSGSGTSGIGPVAMVGSAANLISTATSIKAGSVPGMTAAPLFTPATVEPATQPSLPDLTAQATYTSLGWAVANSGAAWKWETGVRHPAPSTALLPPLKRAGVTGAGTVADPYLIGSVANFLAMQEAISSAASSYAAAHYRLSADIDLDGADFAGFDRLSGSLNGEGHAISDFTLVPGAASADLGLIRELTGTVRGLKLTEVSTRPVGSTTRVAALAVTATGVEGKAVSVSHVEITDADLQGGDVVGGIIASATGLVDVFENVVDADVSAAELAGGVVGEIDGGAIVRTNLVDVRATADKAGLVVGTLEGDATSVSNNVIHGGSVSAGGRVIGDISGDGAWTATDNLANTGITVAGATVSGPGEKKRHGTDASSGELQNKETYTGIGWNFIDSWRWDADAHRPVIKNADPEKSPNRITNTFYGDPMTRRAFTWYQNIDVVQAGVLLSTDPSFPDSATSIVPATTELSEDGENIFRAVATELTPGLTYYYRVGEVFTGYWSETGTFQTPDGESDFSFIDVADTQARGGASEAVVSAATLEKALTVVPDSEFIVHNGDVVQTSEDELDWRELFEVSQESLLATTIAPVSGNHDLAPNRFVDHFTLEYPNNQDTTTGAYYSYDYNGAHFVMINTNDGGADSVGSIDYEPLTDGQIQWIRDDVAAARERGVNWVIMTTHKGPFTAGAHVTEPDMLSLRDRLVPLIDELNIDLVLQGHDHYWSRTNALESDPDSPYDAAAVDNDVITEVVGGVHIDYKVDQSGAVYVNPGTAGAKHYAQVTDADGKFDLEGYLDLFDRLGGGTRWGNSGESFLEIKVGDERLTVNRYEIAGRGAPTFAEGFGIDRQTTPIDDQLGALPERAAVVLGDEPAIAQARAAVTALTKAQRGYLKNLTRLEDAEEALKVLRHTVAIDGSEVAWADAEAVTRQSIEVRNEQRRSLEDVPVRLSITDTPDVTPSSFALTTSRSVPISFEVETWNVGGTSVIWAKLPSLPKQSTQTLWAYFGGTGAPNNDPEDVWSNQFELVEHFASTLESGEAKVDSTGKATGTVVGDGLVASVADTERLAGSGVTRFDNSRLQYAQNFGRYSREFTVSGIYSLTPADLSAIKGQQTAVIAQKKPGATDPTLQFGIMKADGSVKTVTPFDSANSTFPVNGEPHLVTMTFDGMTFAIFVDGVETSESMAEFRQYPDLPGVPTLVGDTEVNADDANLLTSPFHGVIDELWVASTEFIPELDAFRAANYFGDAVTLGKRTVKAVDDLNLEIGSPGNGAKVEAGLVDVSGSVDKRSTLTATIDGDVVFTQQVEAGTFTLPIPVTTAGDEIAVEFAASTIAEPVKRAEPTTLTLKVTDTTAPAQPVTSDLRPAGEALTLKVTPQSDVPEKVSAQFYANQSVTLNGDNTVVRTGSTSDRVPTALTPNSGSVVSGITPTTVGDDKNPFQIYRISLTDEQVSQDEWHFSWRGTADTRTVSAWVWNTETSAWVMKQSDSSPEGDTVNLDVRAADADHPVSTGKELTVLVWRGLTALPWADDRDYDNTLPSPDDYDWSFNHVGDTQLYTEATPWTMTEQFQYISDNADERKTAMVVQAGDWVNREEYEDEWQWRNAEPSALALEDSKIPYLVSWGNHDYNETRNGRQMLAKWFPMERFENSLADSPWTFGGSNDIDNFYYTGEQSGTKILWLSLGFWSANSDDDPGIVWAKSVIAAHPEYTVILSTHDYLVASGADNYSNPRINTLLVDPYPNVKLVLAGHNSGTFVSTRTNSGGTRVYGILTDYQTRAWGGHGFLKNLSVDAENGLIYVNTYSPWLQETTSDGRWNNPVDAPSVPGFHGKNAENYIIELDLGGTQTRTLGADRVTFAAGAPQTVGGAIQLTGEELGQTTFEPAVGENQEWYVILTDRSGNATTSATQLIRRLNVETIDYDLAGGALEEGTTNPTRYNADDEFTLVNPSRTGYSFSGWTGTGLSSPSTSVVIAEGTTGALSFTATWSLRNYGLTYDLAGGYLSGPNPSTYSVTSTDLTLLKPKRSGYTFAGWTGTGLTQPTVEVTIASGSTGDRAFVATWTPLPVTTPDPTNPPTDPVTTTLSAGNVTVVYGKAPTVTVKVTGTAAGTVTLYKGSTKLGSAGIRSGTATVVVPAKTLAPGKHTVTAKLPASSTSLASSKALTLTVSKAKPSISVTATKSVKAKKGKAKIVVVVKAPSGVSVAGKVKITIAGKTKTVVLKNGKATLAAAKQSKSGKKTVKVTYLGSTYLLTGTKSTTFTVKK